MAQSIAAGPSQSDRSKALTTLSSNLICDRTKSTMIPIAPGKTKKKNGVLSDSHRLMSQRDLCLLHHRSGAANRSCKPHETGARMPGRRRGWPSWKLEQVSHLCQLAVRFHRYCIVGSARSNPAGRRGAAGAAARAGGASGSHCSAQHSAGIDRYVLFFAVVLTPSAL